MRVQRNATRRREVRDIKIVVLFRLFSKKRVTDAISCKARAEFTGIK